LPAWGLWMRHVRNVTIDGFCGSHLGRDGRPAWVAVDVEGLKFTQNPVWNGLAQI
jgi:hypothetical protein